MRSIILIIFITLFSFSVNAQCRKKSKDNIHFGFFIGGNYSMLQADEGLQSQLAIYNGMGSQLGIFMDYSITDRFFISPKLELSFNNSGVEITNNDQTISKYEVFPVSLQAMTYLNLKLGSGKTAPYLFIGPNVRFPIAKKTLLSTTFQNNYNLSIDIGIGLENYFKNFVFAPEVKYSYGLLNVNGNPLIKSLKYHQIGVVFNFK